MLNLNLPNAFDLPTTSINREFPCRNNLKNILPIQTTSPVVNEVLSHKRPTGEMDGHVNFSVS
jgi:hypothetical protein